MQYPKAFRLAAAPVLLLLAAGSALAFQPTTLIPAPTATSAPSAPSALPAQSAATVDPEIAIAAANAALGRATALYQSYKSYSDIMRVNYDISVKTSKGDNPQTMEDVLELKYAAPDKFALRNAEAIFTDNGKTKSAYLRPNKRYLQRDNATWAEVAGPMEPIINIHPVAALLLGRVGGDRIFPLIDEVTTSRKGDHEGKPALFVVGKARVPFGFDADPVDVILAFADSDGALLSVQFNLLESMKRMYARQLAELKAEMAKLPPEQRQDIQVDPQRWLLTLTLTEAKKDSALDEKEFTFNPGPKDKKVENILDPGDSSVEAATPEALIGLAAPAFAAPMLDGSMFSLASLSGKVVVLDFWATWCAPCVAAVPELVKLAAEFEPQGVVFLGINQDRGQTEKVAKFITDNKITFQQVLDKESAISGEYNIQAIPTLFVIDKAGIVRAVHSGFEKGQQQAIREMIEMTLAGKFPEAGAGAASGIGAGGESGVGSSVGSAGEAAATDPAKPAGTAPPSPAPEAALPAVTKPAEPKPAEPKPIQPMPPAAPASTPASPPISESPTMPK